MTVRVAAGTFKHAIAEPLRRGAEAPRRCSSRKAIAAFAWKQQTLAGELPQVPLADGLALLLLARDVEPARFDRGAPRWHLRLCAERQPSIAEAQLTLAALDALRSPGGESAAEALASICPASRARP